MAFYLCAERDGRRIIRLCAGEYGGRLTVKLFLLYAAARYQTEAERYAYDCYIADCLRIIGENTAHIAGGGYIKARWSEMKEAAYQPPETRSGEEIKEHMKKVLGEIGRR